MESVRFRSEGSRLEPQAGGDRPGRVDRGRTASSAPAGESSPSFQELAEKMGKQIDRGERLIRRVTHGGAGLDAAQLIALQAGIYRYSEALELASKVVERTADSAKTVLQSGH
jgi:hypothetical protein